MKANLYTRLAVFVWVAALLAACSAATPEDDKKGRLEALKKQQLSLSKEIKILEEQIAKENPDAKKAKAKEVTVAVLKARDFDHYVQTQGHVESENNIMVSAKTMGVVERVLVTEGQQVSKGQILAQIDNSLVRTSIESMQSQLELAKTVYTRQKNLWDQKIGTEVQYLQAKTNKESLEKQLASLQEQNNMTRIKSPISGTVDQIMVKVGENISPGMPAARVINTNDLKLVANVSEAYVTNVKKGNKALITIPELKKEIEGTVSFVGRNIDQLSRTFTVEINLKSQADLRPNMTATVKVIFTTEKDAMVVPINIIQTVNDQKIVYVAEKQGNQTVARKKVVTVDGVYSNQAQVEGLKDGDQIITFGYQGLNDGEVIKI
jgi:membrane fusion protein (multidrug efflux system)